MEANPVPALNVHQPLSPPRLGVRLAAHKFCVVGAAIADNEVDGSDTFTVNVPVVVPEGIVTVGHAMPGGKMAVAGQFTVTAPTNPPAGCTVIVEVPVANVPAAAGVVVIVIGLGLTVIVNVPVFALTVKLTELEDPPPGLGFVTNTIGVPAAAMALAGMETMICVAVTEVGTSPALVPKVTFELLMKFVPLIVSVNAAPPAVALVGEIVVTVGTGLLVAPVMVKATAAEALPVKLASPL
jgi:hypothetical protein